MKRSCLGILLLGFVFVTIVAISEYAPAKAKLSNPVYDDAKKIADEAMENVKDGNTKGFFDVLINSSLSNKERVDALRTLEQQTEQQREGIIQKAGKPIREVEFVRIETIGGSYVRFSYLEKFTYMSVVWKISFYKATDKWELSDIFFKEGPEARNELYELRTN